MKIGIVTYYRHDALASLAQVRAVTAEVLQAAHELQPYSAEFPFASRARRHQLTMEWLANCDAVIGPIDEALLHARHEARCRTPYICLLLGHLSRGGLPLASAHRYLRTSDVLIGNCAADLSLVDLFLQNATAERVPFGFDASLFYPADEAAQRALRERWSIGPSEKIVLYAGRIALEKNLHTLLKAFRVVRDVMPARLVIAGGVTAHPFHQFGAFPLGMMRMVRRLMAQLDLDERHVLFVGDQSPEALRDWYSTADVLANLTLNHDENFGLAQIEAMACGLPAVGTAWGGLNDTIVDGVTGYRVPTVATPAGVKVDWWRAASRLLQLLESGQEHKALRQSCRDRVESCFSTAHYQRGLERAIAKSVAAAATDAWATPLRPTAFAEQIWTTCFEGSYGDGGFVDLSLPPYRRGNGAWDLYRQMIARFTDASCDVPLSSPAEEPRGWCLASSLIMCDDGIAIDDPIYPQKMPVPDAMADDVRRLVQAFTEQPVQADAAFEDCDAGVREALAWMHASGLLLRTVLGKIEPARAHRALGQPAFVIHEVAHRSDILYIA